MSKKAWQIELETMQNSIPVVLKDEEQGWNYAETLEMVEDAAVAMKWHSNVPGSHAEEHVIIGAMQDMENMGYDISAAEAMIETGRKYLEEGNKSALAGHTARTWHVMMNSPKIPDHPYWKHTIYESFEQYAAAVTFPTYEYDMEGEDFLRRTHLGWQGQIVAGAIGTAVEGYVTKNIRKVFGEIYDYPRTPNTFNDDITYELALIKAIEKAGKNVTSADIAEQWVALVPMGWSAEEIALANLKLGVFPPMSGYLNNPYREWIGAQMRGVICGQLFPGKPYEAARLAWMDGQVSHHNNGILGEVFNAVMASLSYVETNIRKIVKMAIDMIPADSEYYTVVKFAWDECLKHEDWESAWKVCEKKYERYNWIHAYPNAAAEVVAMYFGNGDFDETMHIIAMCGWDVDCNAAQIATVIAAANKVELNEKWTAPIGDKLDTYMRDIKKLSIYELSKHTCELARMLNS
ncbi:MAG: ADP-ribosylglycohydrolase family protein [Clostridiales bacterium]|nr:ADP-ribosylglycohydrolase family protein [Clostridiales bacterium]